MTTPTNQDNKFADLQRALTALAASGVSIQFCEIYHCGQRMTAIIMPNVTITEQGRLMIKDEK
jgi:hypothetical protein